MGLKKEYLRYGRSARDRIFGWLGVPPPAANEFNRNISTAAATHTINATTGSTVSVGSQQTTGRAGSTTSSSRTHSRSHPYMRSRATPLSMLISQGAKLSNSKWKKKIIKKYLIYYLFLIKFFIKHIFV